MWRQVGGVERRWGHWRTYHCNERGMKTNKGTDYTNKLFTSQKLKGYSKDSDNMKNY